MFGILSKKNPWKQSDAMVDEIGRLSRARDEDGDLIGLDDAAGFPEVMRRTGDLAALRPHMLVAPDMLPRRRCKECGHEQTCTQHAVPVFGAIMSSVRKVFESVKGTGVELTVVEAAVASACEAAGWRPRKNPSLALRNITVDLLRGLLTSGDVVGRKHMRGDVSDVRFYLADFAPDLTTREDHRMVLKNPRNGWDSAQIYAPVKPPVLPLGPNSSDLLQYYQSGS